MDNLQATYKKLINQTLPATYTSPVRYNHCFNRIILDWLFEDCWYHHLNKKRTAISQLSELQLEQAIERMNEWLHNHQVLINDNQNSLRWRKKLSGLATLSNKK